MPVAVPRTGRIWPYCGDRDIGSAASAFTFILTTSTHAPVILEKKQGHPNHRRTVAIPRPSSAPPKYGNIILIAKGNRQQPLAA